MLDQLTSFVFSLPGGKPTAAIALLAVFAVLFYAVYAALFFLLKKFAERTKTDFDDVLFKSMEHPSLLLVLLSAVFASLALTYPETKAGTAGLSHLYVVALMFNAAFALERLVTTLLDWYRKEIAPKTETKFDDEMVPVLEKTEKFVIYVFAFVLMLSNLGIEITPLLAGLGIASLAVALALQDSLGNFFAGVNIAVDRPLRKEDYISTDGGVEGVVQEIGWRSTKILTNQNNMVIIPNTKLAASTVINYYKPDETVLYPCTVGISYDDDVERASQAIRAAIAKAAEKYDQIDGRVEPVIRLDSFGDFSINFRFLVPLKDYRFHLNAADAVYRAIFYEFKGEGITIPYPTRTLYMAMPPQAKKHEAPQPAAEEAKAGAEPSGNSEKEKERKKRKK